MTDAVTALSLGAVLLGGFIIGSLVTAVALFVAKWRRLDEAEQQARLAWDVGYRAGLVEGMAAEDRLTAQRDALMAELKTANEAFDECTGDYAKELVAEESWRMTGVTA